MLRRIAAGETHPRVAAAVGCSTKSVQRLLVRSGGLASQTRPRSALRPWLAEREEISRGLEAGASCRAIAQRIGGALDGLARHPHASEPDPGRRLDLHPYAGRRPRRLRGIREREAGVDLYRHPSRPLQRDARRRRGR
ncbi:MAG: helix-turn-helix domain-containing protein [Chloroflexota bacterium]|nr:hypothetical protein [Chloroflexota bacterium]MDE3102299.1 helix-turn-helix domain-containing protein [Chloroflexota bacterium]